MSRWWWVVVLVGSSCGSNSRPDSGVPPVPDPGCETLGPPSIPAGCECGTINVHRCITELVDCGRCATGMCSQNVCVGPPWDGGMSGSLVGLGSFTPAAVTSARHTLDVGTGRTQRLQVFFFDQPVSGCGTPAPPFSVTEVRVEVRFGRVLALGTYPLDGPSMVSRADGLGTVGSVTIERIDTVSTAGQFTTSLSLNDGGSAPLTGTWDTALCP